MPTVQSILFKNSVYNLQQAIAWLSLHHFKIEKVHRTKNFMRFRQVSPLQLKKEGYSYYITKPIDNGNILIILAYR